MVRLPDERRAPRTGILLLLLLVAVPVAAQPVALTADLQAPRQSFLGFGATLKPLVYGGTDYLSPPERQAAMKAAVREVGISTGNLEMTVESHANDNLSPFVANPSGLDFAFHQQAVAAIVTPGAPLGLTDWYPGSRIDLRYNHAWMIPVREANYDNYLDEVAENVLQQLVWWRDVYGQVPALMQLFNEPTTGNRELQNSNEQEVVDIVKRVGARVRAAGFADVLFVVPNEETVERNTAVAQALYDDVAARPYVGAIGYHTYPYGSPYTDPAAILAQSGTGNPNAGALAQRATMRALADQLSAALGRTVPLWLTEVSEGPGNNVFAFDAIESLRARAIHIHDEILYTSASAYYGMLLLWDGKSHYEHFLGRGECDYESEGTSIVLIDNFDCGGRTATGAVRITSMGHAMGHYARWMDSGTVIVATTSADPRVQVTGFLNGAGRQLGLVLLNNRPEAVAVEVSLESGEIAGAVTGEASYASVRWGPAPAVSTSSNRLSLTLPPESVVSLRVSLRVDTVKAPGPELGTSSLAAPFPNPTSGATQASFTLANPGPVRLDVVDVLGRVVAVLADDVRPAGRYDSRLLPGLPAGRYLLRLQTPDGTESAPLTIVR